MAKLVLDREIYCPLDRVFAYHTDLERAPEYWAPLRECRPLVPAAPAPGSRFAWRYVMFGREFTGEMTVVDHVPGERFAFAIEGGITSMFRHTYRATARTRTYVVVSVDYEVPLGLLGRAVDRLLVEQRNAADGRAALDELQRRLEAEQARNRILGDRCLEISAPTTPTSRLPVRSSTGAWPSPPAPTRAPASSPPSPHPAPSWQSGSTWIPDPSASPATP